MKLNKDIICFYCKGCGDLEVNTTLSTDPTTGNVTKTTILGKIWCDYQEDNVEPRFRCPCYKPEPDNLEEEDTPESPSVLFFQADEETCRRIQALAQQNRISEGELITRLLNMAYPEEK